MDARRTPATSDPVRSLLMLDHTALPAVGCKTPVPESPGLGNPSTTWTSALLHASDVRHSLSGLRDDHVLVVFHAWAMDGERAIQCRRFFACDCRTDRHLAVCANDENRPTSVLSNAAVVHLPAPRRDHHHPAGMDRTVSELRRRSQRTLNRSPSSAFHSYLAHAAAQSASRGPSEARRRPRHRRLDRQSQSRSGLSHVRPFRWEADGDREERGPPTLLDQKTPSRRNRCGFWAGKLRMTPPEA